MIPLIRSPSVREILFMVPSGLIPSFLYVLDIVKDSVQLFILANAVHGLWYAFKYWYSFSSVVSLFISIFWIIKVIKFQTILLLLKKSSFSTWNHIFFFTNSPLIWKLSSFIKIDHWNFWMLTKFYFTDDMVYFSIYIGSNTSSWYFEKKKW